MIDFSRVDGVNFKLADLQQEITHADLIAATNYMIDRMLAMVRDVPDSYVTFQPVDPDAYDAAAATAAETNLAWTLGHVIVHATASAEEAASIGSSMARGVEVNWRDRYETPWETMKTTRHLIDRLEESRRIRLAYLNAWPHEPHYEVKYIKSQRMGEVNAIGYTLNGLKHDYGHLGQIAEIIRQAREAEAAAATK